MRAILRKQFGGPEVLEIREVPGPEPKAGHAVIQVKALWSDASRRAALAARHRSATRHQH